jgi:CubicO group peptidase (beta-lactamase class C family)
MKRRQFAIAMLLAGTCLFVETIVAGPLPSASPEESGFSLGRLEKVHAMVQGCIDEGKHAGAITAIARGGRIVDFKTYGYRDIEAGAPMERDTIVRIYSMSKVIATAAVMQLFEEARFSLDDPIAKFIPELGNLKVCAGGTADAPVLADAKKPITITHLLTHTSGFAYEFSAKEPVKTLYGKSDMLEADSLKEFIQRLAKLPLAQQPGEGFLYGVNIDVLGYLVEVVSGKPFEVYLRERIFDPLKMKDTGFDVPEEKMKRLAKMYEQGPDGKLRLFDKPPYGAYAEKGRGFSSGGGGLFSTADDYLRFAQMLLNGGKLDGKQILGRKTVELMLSNHLTFLDKSTTDGNQSEGFGYGGLVVVDSERRNKLGSTGLFGWDGAATTTFRIDPKERTVALLFAQHLPFNQHGVFEKFYTLFYASLVD